MILGFGNQYWKTILLAILCIFLLTHSNGQKKLEVITPEGHKNPIIDFDINRNRLATVAMDELVVKVWGLERDELIRSLRLEETPKEVYFINDESILIITEKNFNRNFFMSIIV